jgi:predicted amidophosphoribosyltransferase
MRGISTVSIFAHIWLKIRSLFRGKKRCFACSKPLEQGQDLYCSVECEEWQSFSF